VESIKAYQLKVNKRVPVSDRGSRRLGLRKGLKKLQAHRFLLTSLDLPIQIPPPPKSKLSINRKQDQFFYSKKESNSNFYFSLSSHRFISRVGLNQMDVGDGA
jgi:hypothetical protein